MAAETLELAPVRGRARIEVLDILRGIAILGIIYMNVPYMGNNGTLFEYDIRRIGWSAADQNAWAIIQIYWEGTQRGLLEFLFGAGVMILTAKAMTPDGPVAVADLYYRRNLWLLAFGLVDIFLITWIGDILHAYALAALFIFPFRKLSARTLILLGLLFAVATAVGAEGKGIIEYQARTQLTEQAQAAQTRQQAKQPLTKEDKAALADWRKLTDHLDLRKKPDADTLKGISEEAAAHRAAPMPFILWAWKLWHQVFVLGNASFFLVLEAICGMFLGMAFWKLGIIQGGRTKRFYACLAILAYGFGLSARSWGVLEALQFTPEPKTIWITKEFARLAVSLGHLAMINLLFQTRAGKMILSPFKAAGQTAFSLYILTSLVGLWVVFAPWGLNLWGQYSWAGLATAATIMAAALLILANIWARFFLIGPLEWLWRSLAYWERQPFRRHHGQRTEPAEPGTEINPPLPA